MALNCPRSALSSSLRRCRPSAPALSSTTTVPSRQFSQTTARRFDAEPERPRWDHTPERMKGPGFSLNIVKDPKRKVWSVNEDPKKLDAMYTRFLGPGGDRLLPDEIKWLAVTHKSFDQGRRGFNTRLAYFGRMILSYEATRSILVNPAVKPDIPETDEFGRAPFRHPALTNVDKLAVQQPRNIISVEKIAQLAVEVGLPDVTRWKPRLPESLDSSGLPVVMNTTVFAILGAISLHCGADVAARLAREKILKRLGA